MNKTTYAYTQNRELSWLKFNERVLEEADDPQVPLLERLKFISIFTSNLDEFYMIRCGSLYDVSLLKDMKKDNKSGMTAQEQLHAIFKACISLYEHRDQTYLTLKKQLRQHNIENVSVHELDKKEERWLHDYFINYIFPLLSPQIIDSHHPFPHLANKSLYVMVRIRQKSKSLYGLIPVPASLSRVIYLPDHTARYVLLEHVLFHYVQEVFSNYEITFKTIVKVTRNADINLNSEEIDDDEDYRQMMKKILKKRNRLAPIRLEIYKFKDDDFISYLCDRLNIHKNQVFISHTPLEMSYVFDVVSRIDKKHYADLLYDHFAPVITNKLSLQKPLIPQIQQKDVLLFYPFDSMKPFLQLLKEAASDPKVVSIKITIYRLAKNSKIIKYLLQALDNGKEVTVLMELRARFDEQNNIDNAEMLEENGCTILYGFERYKVHSKICLITRKNGKNIEYITQIGTGNYNEKTSEAYTDLSYITARENIGKDASLFFQNMALSNLNDEYEHLLVAPNGLKKRILELIDKEMEKAKNDLPSNIIIKMNALTDRDIIDKLKDASCAGVHIHLIIRGICCLVPDVAQYSENISITGIVGRFLEHSRIYCFGSDTHASIYISSADFMTRNTEKRVEIACPIYDSDVKQEILHILHVIMNDNVKARKINHHGDYEKFSSLNDPIDSQDFFMKQALSQNEVIEEPKSSLSDKLRKLMHR